MRDNRWRLNLWPNWISNLKERLLQLITHQNNNYQSKKIYILRHSFQVSTNFYFVSVL
jgi:hypothetical protein